MEATEKYSFVFEPIDMPGQKVSSKGRNFLDLHAEYLDYRHDFKRRLNESEDVKAPVWDDEHRCFSYVRARRSSVVAVEKAATIYGQWSVTISVNGMREDIVIYFDSKDSKKSTELIDKLADWMVK